MRRWMIARCGDHQRCVVAAILTQLSQAAFLRLAGVLAPMLCHQQRPGLVKAACLALQRAGLQHAGPKDWVLDLYCD
jgi:hypothetical protein